MPLHLSVIRCPDHVAPQDRAVPGGSLVIGRGPGADWALPDPERILSKRHCALEFLAGGWQLRDMSTNGTFVNAEAAPLGPDGVRVLRSGDRLRLGGYEIECRVQEEAGWGEGRWAAPSAMPDPMLGAVQPFPPPGQPLPGGAAPLLPLDFDPLAAEDPGPAMPDHRPSWEAAFVPPRAAMPDLLPEDWEGLGAAAPQAPAAPALPDPFAEPFPAPAPPPALPASLPEPVAAPVPRPAAEPLPPAAERRPPMPPAAGPSANEALASFLRAAGLPPPPPGAEGPETLAQAGRLLAAAVAGLRALLVARGQVKQEFRIEQTMLRARGNNPLKFAAGDAEALRALLEGGATGADALAEVVRDLCAHQLATIAATQAASRALLARLAPAALEAGAPPGGLPLPGQRERRLWDAYRRLHAQVTEQFDDDFDSAFGTAFARAYEDASRRG